MYSCAQALPEEGKVVSHCLEPNDGGDAFCGEHLFSRFMHVSKTCMKLHTHKILQELELERRRAS